MPEPEKSPKQQLVEIEAAIEALEERRREIYRRSVKAPENEKVCENRLAEMLGEPTLFKRIEYPFPVHGITFSGELLGRGRPPGMLVKVRPCAEEFEGKTYLGIYLGDYAQTVSCSLNHGTGVLDVQLSRHNPTIWIPSKQRIVHGHSSWWGRIESVEQLEEITDETIDGVWYVQAMRAMAKGD